MKIQNSSNTNAFNKTNFKGKTPHTAANFNPEKKIGIKEYKKQLLILQETNSLSQNNKSDSKQLKSKVKTLKLK